MADLFTPQQRQGGATFHHTTLLGNWREDLESQTHKFKYYMRKKDENTLNVPGAADRLSMTFAAIERAPCHDGMINFGDYIGCEGFTAPALIIGLG